MNYTDKQIEAMIKGIESGRITETNLPKGYYKALTSYLERAVFDGFGASLTNVSTNDYQVLEELIVNTYQFGAAKTFQQTKAITELLTDLEGNVRSSREFNNLARSLYDNWNDNWGKTEYNTALGQAENAAKWKEAIRQQDILPNLQYEAVMDKNTSDICRPLHGIIAPVNDPIWKKIMPLNHHNCRCLVFQTDDRASRGYSKIVAEVEKDMKPLFINNVGESGQIWTKDHPYFEVEKKYKQYAKRNFDLPLPKL